MRDLTFQNDQPERPDETETLLRLNAEIVSVVRPQGTNEISARVRLRFRFSDLAESRAREMATSVSLIENDSFHWRRTKRQIVAAAWEWLDAYFDGARVGVDGDNLFSDIFDAGTGRNASGLTPEEEHSLQRELHSIEQDS